MATKKRYRVWLKKKDITMVKVIDTLKVYIDDALTGKEAKVKAEMQNPGYKASGVFIANIDTNRPNNVQ